MNSTIPGLFPCITERFLSELATDTTTLHWVNSFLNIPFAITAALANALILWTFFRTKSLHSPSNMLLIGLALSDFFAGLFVQPLYIVYQVAVLTGSSSVCCHAGIAFAIASRFVACTSLVTLAAVSFERYIALRLHLRCKEIITMKRVVILLVSVWILSAFLSASWLIHRSVTSFLTVILLIASISISVFSCFNISGILRRHRRQIEQENACVGGLNQIGSLEKKLAEVTLYLNCAFLFCFMPYACTVVVIRATGWGPSKLVALHFTGTLVFINSSLDPLIFCWRLKQIRTALVQSLTALFSQSEETNSS